MHGHFIFKKIIIYDIIIFNGGVVNMKKYSNLVLIMAYILVIMSLFISVHYLYIIELVLFVEFIGVYFVMDNSSTQFLSKLKYPILVSILLYFFVLRKKDGGYYGVTQGNLFFADALVLLTSVFLLFIMIRIDRLVSISKIKDVRSIEE